MLIVSTPVVHRRSVGFVPVRAVVLTFATCLRQASPRACLLSWRQSGVRDNSFPGQRGYASESSRAPMTELVLLASVIGLLALIWMGLDSDDDNGGGGLMQPVLQPVRLRERG